MRRYAWRVRRWWTVLLALLLLVLVCWTTGATEVPVPTVIGGVSGARVAQFTPVLVVVAVMYCLERRLGDAESAAVVAVRGLDRAALAVTALLAQGAGLAVGMDIARNVMLLLALGLLVRRVANEAAASTAALAFLLLNLILGHGGGPGGRATSAWWAIPLHPGTSAPAWLVSAALFALALALLGTRERA